MVFVLYVDFCDWLSRLALVYYLPHKFWSIFKKHLVYKIMKSIPGYRDSIGTEGSQQIVKPW